MFPSQFGQVRSVPLMVGVMLFTALGGRGVRAEHDAFFTPLEAAARDLHESLICFERIASCRPLPACDRRYLQVSVQQACRLVNDVSCCNLGATLRDFTLLRVNLEMLNRRLHMNCALRGDAELWCQWAQVMRCFQRVRCLVNASSLGGFPPPAFRSDFGEADHSISLGPVSLGPLSIGPVLRGF